MIRLILGCRGVPRRWSAIASLALLPLLGCRGVPVGVGETASLTVTADLRPVFAVVAPVSGTVTVTAADIAVPVVSTLFIEGATATGHVVVPVGAARTFAIVLRDAAGATLASGAGSGPVIPGLNPALTITLTLWGARVGTVPIVVTFGAITTTLTPATATVAVGSTASLAATASDAGGFVLSSGPSSFAWASVNANVATVSALGVVTGRAPGSTQVVANFQGAADTTLVTVQ